MMWTRKPKPRLLLVALPLGLAIAFPAASLVAARLSGPIPTETSSSPALAVSVLEARRSDQYQLRRVYTGRVEANRTSGLGFERSGLLQRVLVREGDTVAAGQVVARLDTALLEARRRELAAALASADADLALAEATLARYQQSIDRGAVTRQALDETREGANAARSAVDLARARIASVDLDIAKSELRAPFDSVVIERLMDEGRVVAAGGQVVRLQERVVPEIRVGIAGPLADTLRTGSVYPISWRGLTFPARLRAVLPVRGLGTRTLDALFVPEESPPGLRPGELVQLSLSEPISEPGFWLPLSALAEGPRGLWQAYAVEPLSQVPAGIEADHRIDPRPLEILYHEVDRAYVRGPLRDGEPIVSNGLHRVVSGQPVRVLPFDSEQIAMEVR